MHTQYNNEQQTIKPQCTFYQARRKQLHAYLSTNYYSADQGRIYKPANPLTQGGGFKDSVEGPKVLPQV